VERVVISRQPVQGGLLERRLLLNNGIRLPVRRIVCGSSRSSIYLSATSTANKGKLTRPGFLSSKSTTSPQDDRTLILAELFSRALIFGDNLESDCCSLSLVEDFDELDGVLDRSGSWESTLVELEILFSVKKLHWAEVGYERIERQT
jgi:hypothetical protein